VGVPLFKTQASSQLKERATAAARQQLRIQVFANMKHMITRWILPFTLSFLSSSTSAF
jgi:hypothetical protein